MNRQAFFEQIRQAAAEGRKYRVSVPEIDPQAGYIGGGAKPAETLIQQVIAVGGQGHIAPDWESAQAYVADLLTEHQVKSLLCWEHSVLDRLRVQELASSRGITVWSPAALAPLSQDEQRRTMVQCDFGVTSVSWAVAETGSMALAAQAEQPRVASLLPPVYLTVLTRDQIVPDLFDVFTELGHLGPDGLPSNLAFVTGPSKTGDIELKLTTGVHGPGIWYVLVIDAAEPLLG